VDRNQQHQWTITAGAAGSGNGSVSDSVDANSGPAQTGTLTIAGHTYTLTQSPITAPPPGCTVSTPAAPQVARIINCGGGAGVIVRV